MKHDETENQIELEKIFREGLFIISHKTSKVEFLADLAGVLEGKRLVGEDYLPSLMEREEIVPTYLGNGLAAPHPVEAEVLETVIAVCICPAGVDWNGEKRAQVVFMLAVKNEEQKRLATLYTLISDLVENPKVMGELKRVTDFESFMRVLQTV